MTQALNLSQFANKLNSSGATDNTGLQNSAITITPGTGMSGGGSVALGSSVTINNAGVTSFNGSTGAVTFTGVPSVNGQTGAVVTTDFGGIGSCIVSYYAVNAPYPNLGGAYNCWGGVSNYTAGTTTSGSNLRYNIANATWYWASGNSTGNQNSPFSQPQLASVVNGGRASLPFPSIGTSLSGSWRSMNSFSIGSSYTPAGKDPENMSANWQLALWMRYA